MCINGKPLEIENIVKILISNGIMKMTTGSLTQNITDIVNLLSKCHREEFVQHLNPYY